MRNEPPISTSSPRETTARRPAGQRGQGEQQRRGVVVDHQRRLGPGRRPQQALGAAVAVAAAPGLEVELEVAVGVEEGGQGRGDLGRQRSPAEVGVDQDAGGVEDPPQRRPQLLPEGRLDARRKRLERRLQAAARLTRCHLVPQCLQHSTGLDLHRRPSV